MHKSHLLGCAVGVAAALVILALSGGSLGALGVLVAALVCPLMMLVMMKTMMGDHSAAPDGHGAQAADGGPDGPGRPVTTMTKETLHG